MQPGGYAVGYLIQLAIGDSFVAEDDSDVIRRLRHLRFEEREYGLRVIIVHVCLVETIQQRCLLLVHQRDGAQRGFGILGERIHGIANRLREALHHLAAVTAVVVLNRYRRFAIYLHDIERNLELRHVQFHILRLNRLSLHLVFGKDAELVGVHDFCCQVIIGGYLCKRVVLMRECLLEFPACLPNELLHALRTYLAAQCKRVHHHANRVRHLEVAPAVGNSSDTEIVVVREARERVEYCRECCTGCGHACGFCHLLGSLQIHWRIDLPYLAVFRVGQVRR